MKIGLDFDHVVFNTEKFKRKLFDEIERYDETYKQAENEDGAYIPEKHAEILNISVEEIHNAIRHAEECLYNDVDRLRELADEHELVIVSRGDQHFQSEKVKVSGILDYVDDFFIVEQKPKDKAADIDFLVDDAPFEHEKVSLSDKYRFLFDRSKHTMEDVVERIEKLKQDKASLRE